MDKHRLIEIAGELEELFAQQHGRYPSKDEEMQLFNEAMDRLITEIAAKADSQS